MGAQREPPPLDESKQQIYRENADFNLDSISVEEVQKVISKLKTHKAPGPDGIITEFFKWLDQENCRTLAQCHAHVACIYKKGAHDNPENY